MAQFADKVSLKARGCFLCRLPMGHGERFEPLASRALSFINSAIKKEGPLRGPLACGWGWRVCCLSDYLPSERLFW